MESQRLFYLSCKMDSHCYNKYKLEMENVKQA